MAMATHAYIIDKTELQRLRGIRKDKWSLERMLSVLDAMDGDPDLEDNGDGEPSIGSCSGRSQIFWSWGNTDDRELDFGEDDLQLGWANEGSQLRLHGLNDEYEDDDPGGGNIEDEPQMDDGEREPWRVGMFDGGHGL
jgi:hypothetical protein